MKILAVDDDDFALAVLERALRDAEYDVTLASNGTDALRKIQENAIRIVITDWNMPQMSGIELCRAVREESHSGYVYVILLTGREGTDNIVEALAAGADELLSKPFRPVELIMRLRAAERVVARDTRDLTIFAMAKLAESRDMDTGLHLERVRSYSRVLADEIAGRTAGIKSISQLIYQTSPLHDIGKVGIPDCILCKPGRLSRDEFEVMKTHTTIGADTLEAVAREYPDVPFLRTATDIARSHHERFDGTGYPMGLRGDEIPLTGRIVAVADVYDALTNKRAYKPAFSHEMARREIVNDAGGHFDPAVVQAFCEREASFLRIHDRFQADRSEIGADVRGKSLCDA